MSDLEGSEAELSKAEGGCDFLSESELPPTPISDGAEGPESDFNEASMPESTNQPQDSTANLNVGPKCDTSTTTTIVISHQPNCYIGATVVAQGKVEVTTTPNSLWLSLPSTILADRQITANLNVGPKCDTPTTTTIVISHQPNCYIEATVITRGKAEVTTKSNSLRLSLSSAIFADRQTTEIFIGEAPPIEDKKDQDEDQIPLQRTIGIDKPSHSQLENDPSPLDVFLALSRGIIYLAQLYIGRPILHLILLALFCDWRQTVEWLDFRAGLNYLQ